MDIASTRDRFGAWARGSLGLRMFVVGLLALVLLIPAAMVRGLIHEREMRRNEAIMEISGKWGNAQHITGPVLTIPYRVYTVDDDGDVRAIIRYAHFLPEELSINGKALPETRYRGIYEAVLYTADIEIGGTFAPPDFGDTHIDTKDVLWNDAVVTLGIADMRGIQDGIVLDWHGTQLQCDPGVSKSPVFSAHVGTRVRLSPSAATGAPIPFATRVRTNGSDYLRFTPMGRTTTVSLESPWTAPSFDGAYLPDSRSITDDGFAAQWKVLHLNRNYPQQWINEEYTTDGSAFGVSLMQPVDSYRKNERSAKYAILFISLTFLAFFMIETLTNRRIHPVQYILVGLALCVFYTLLLALSEHTGFGIAYFAAASAVVTLITGYTATVLKCARLTALLGGILAALYGFLYLLLNLEDYSLLAGSIGLFAVLAVVMFVTRKVNWYTLNAH